jgi:predicted secreted protein
MVIYTKAHLKEVCLHFTPKLQSIFSRNFSAVNIRELVASLTYCNSYAHLCAELKLHPVCINQDGQNKKIFDLLSNKHKIDSTVQQKIELQELCYINPISLLYAPDCNFPVSEFAHAYRPSSIKPITEIKANCVAFLDLAEPTKKPKNEYPEMYIDSDSDVDESVWEYINEKVDVGFSWEADVEKKGLSEADGDKLYSEHMAQWELDNKDKIDDMKTYALQEMAPSRYLSLLADGAVVDNHTFKLASLSGHDLLKATLFERFTKNCSLIYWRTIQVDTEFLSEGEKLRDGFIGTQLIYLGVLDEGQFTPIATASALTLNFTYTHETTLFDICDAHSACMNDIFKEVHKYLAVQNISWDDFITECSENERACVTRLWSHKNIFDDESINVFMAKVFTTNMNVMTGTDDDEFDLELAAAMGSPEVGETCLLFTEVCGAKPADTFINVLNAYNFNELSEDERPSMTVEEAAKNKQQLQFSISLKKALENMPVEVLTYDPWAHPMN